MTERKCKYCQLPTEGGRSRCKKHRERDNTWSQNKRNNLIAKGLCHRCGEVNRLPNCRACLVCTMKERANLIFRDTSKWGELFNKLIKQKNRCYISGVEITIGVDAVLDHIEPKSKAPHRYNDINNLAWCHAMVNAAKADLPLSDFIEKFKLVAKSFLWRNDAVG